MANLPDAPLPPTTQLPELRSTGRVRSSRAARTWRELTAPLAAGDHAAVSGLRHLAHSALTLWEVDAEQAENVVVVLSELATNALRHTDGPAWTRLGIHEDQLVLDVADTSPAMPDFETGPDQDAEVPHGFGLTLIVSALAESLVVTQHPTRGKTVTATFTIRGTTGA